MRDRYTQSDPVRIDLKQVRSQAAANEDAAPSKERLSRGTKWKVAFWCALCVVALGVLVITFFASSYITQDDYYDDIADQYVSIGNISRTEYATPADFDIDWDGLAAVNPDIVGWIYVPGTGINYPVVHRDGDDDYYLTHNFSGDTSGLFGAEYGCIMLSGVNSGDFGDEVNFIYGHNMKNGTMFATLNDFVDADVFNAHRTFYILTPDTNYELSSFAIDRISGDDPDIVIPNFYDGDALGAYIGQRMGESLVEPEGEVADAEEISHVFAFSTCLSSDDSYRIVVFCSVVAIESGDRYPDGQPSGSDALSADDADVGAVDEAAKERTS
ncbi:MAG: class B sortase, partial [Eggerthellaceae bacterium]|nr:class B sortase [Eggerthellaceae bacterium]